MYSLKIQQMILNFSWSLWTLRVSNCWTNEDTWPSVWLSSKKEKSIWEGQKELKIGTARCRYCIFLKLWLYTTLHGRGFLLKECLIHNYKCYLKKLNNFQNNIYESKRRKKFWVKRQVTDSSNIEQWLLARQKVGEWTKLNFRNISFYINIETLFSRSFFSYLCHLWGFLHSL